jgi:hypothetical protein
MDLMKIGYEVGRWMELAQDRVQSRALVLAKLNRCVLLPELLRSVAGSEAFKFHPYSVRLFKKRKSKMQGV